MYTNPNFQSKKQLKEAVKKGEKVEVYSPGPFPAKQDGREFVEGPHYPQPHRWYAVVLLEGGLIKKVLS